MLELRKSILSIYQLIRCRTTLLRDVVEPGWSFSMGLMNSYASFTKRLKSVVMQVGVTLSALCRLSGYAAANPYPRQAQRLVHHRFVLICRPQTVHEDLSIDVWCRASLRALSPPRNATDTSARRRWHVPGQVLM